MIKAAAASGAPAVVLQSWRDGAPPPWLARCLDSVRAWAVSQGHAYRFLDDAGFFAKAPPWALERAGGRPQMVADLARLAWMREVTAEGATAVWLDADTYVFGALALPDDAFACGRETWVQPARKSKVKGKGLTVHRGPHNAAMVARPGNAVIDFLHYATESVLGRVSPGKGPPQLTGPKLLAALNGLAPFPSWEACGALSPSVIRDLAAGGGPALDLFHRESPPLAAANLCASLADDAKTWERALTRLPDTLGASYPGTERPPTPAPGTKPDRSFFSG